MTVFLNASPRRSHDSRSWLFKLGMLGNVACQMDQRWRRTNRGYRTFFTGTEYRIKVTGALWKMKRAAPYETALIGPTSWSVSTYSSLLL